MASSSLQTTTFSILGGSSVGGGPCGHGRGRWREPFSILGGSSVGGGPFSSYTRYKKANFQYPRRIECGWWPVKLLDLATQDLLSVSSADRVWVVARLCPSPAPRPESFSILGGSSVGGGLFSVTCTSAPPLLSVSSADRVWVVGFKFRFGSDRRVFFQYPRRIECGWWPPTARRTRPLPSFQYPRRIECGWW